VEAKEALRDDRLKRVRNHIARHTIVDQPAAASSRVGGVAEFDSTMWAR